MADINDMDNPTEEEETDCLVDKDDDVTYGEEKPMVMEHCNNKSRAINVIVVITVQTFVMVGWMIATSRHLMVPSGRHDFNFWSGHPMLHPITSNPSTIRHGGATTQ